MDLYLHHLLAALTGRDARLWATLQLVAIVLLVFVGPAAVIIVISEYRRGTRLRFGLSTILVAMALIAVVLGLVVYSVE
jgi:succinate dehydrogenase hydrophobic anchor subunit